MTTTPDLYTGMTLVCADCHTTRTKPDNQGAALFVILSGFRYCMATEKRRCRDCGAHHRHHCLRCQQSGA